MSNDEHPKDGNIPANLLMPCPSAALFPGPGADFDECHEGALEHLSDFFGVEHLSECTNAKLFEYPIAGIVSGFGNRFVIPLKVRATQKSKKFIVYFVVDSGSFIISFSNKTAETIFGRRAFGSAIVQDRFVPCRLSGDLHESMKNVNILGSQFLVQSNTYLIVSPNEFVCPYDKMRVFYFTPFSMIGQAQAMAASRQQDPNITKKLEIHPVSTSSGSDPAHSHKRKIEKSN